MPYFRKSTPYIFDLLLLGLTIVLIFIVFYPVPTIVNAQDVPQNKAEESCHYLKDTLKFGQQNDVIEVAKLQYFLKEYEKAGNVVVSGTFDIATLHAVNVFQSKHATEILMPWGYTQPTGHAYILTKKKINELVCEKQISLSKVEQDEIKYFKLRTNKPALIPDSIYTGGAGVTEIAIGEVAGEILSTSSVIASIADTPVEEDVVVILTPEQSSFWASIRAQGSQIGASVFSSYDHNSFLKGLVVSIVFLVILYVFSTLIVMGQKSIVFLLGSCIVILGSFIFDTYYLIFPFMLVFFVSIIIFVLSFYEEESANSVRAPKSNMSIIPAPPRTIMKIEDK